MDKYFVFIAPNGERSAPFLSTQGDVEASPLVAISGYTWEEAEAPAPDPAAKLAADKAFGQQLIDSFVAGSRANNFDLAQTRAINALLSEVEIYLHRGSIGIARDALAEITPSPLFPAEAKAYYLSIIDTYLTP
jgi:hypothetical protein